MAISENPLIKKIKGKLGNVVIYNLKGQTVIRTQAFNNKSNTPLQMQQRMKFKHLSRIGTSIRAFINMGFVEIPLKMNAYNAFIKANIKNAFPGDYPGIFIDFSRLVVSEGSLPIAKRVSIKASVGHKINISWNNNSDNKISKSTDITMALFINQTKNMVSQDTNSRTRGDCSLQYTVPDFWVGNQVHVYLTFKTSTGDKTSNSMFLGSIKILA